MRKVPPPMPIPPTTPAIKPKIIVKKIFIKVTYLYIRVRRNKKIKKTSSHLPVKE